MKKRKQAHCICSTSDAPLLSRAAHLRRRRVAHRRISSRENRSTQPDLQRRLRRRPQGFSTIATTSSDGDGARLHLIEAAFGEKTAKPKAHLRLWSGQQLRRLSLPDSALNLDDSGFGEMKREWRWCGGLILPNLSSWMWYWEWRLFGWPEVGLILLVRNEFI